MADINKWGAGVGRSIGDAGREGKLGGNVGKLASKAMPAAARAVGKAGAGLGNAAGQGGAKAGKSAGDAGEALGQAGAGVGKGISNLARFGLQFAGPVGFIASKAASNWRITVAIILILILFAYLAFQLSGGLLNPQSSTPTSLDNPLTVNVTCSPSTNLKVGDTSTCTITVADTQSVDDIVVVATIYPFAQYVDKSAMYNGVVGGTYANSNATVTWDAKKLGIPLSAPNFTLTLKVTLLKPFNTANIAQGGPITVVANSTGGGNIAATSNNCHGVYSNYMAQVLSVITRLNIPGANFGDPNCDLVEQDPNGNWIINKDKELAYLETIMPAQKAQGVFTCMIPNESSFNADAFNPSSTSAQNGGSPGAFGLLQMNAQGFSNTGQPSDVGDVVWSQQLSNAVNWVNQVHGGAWHGDYGGIPNYWPTSYNSCLAQYGM